MRKFPALPMLASLVAVSLLLSQCRPPASRENDAAMLRKTTEAIRAAFGRGDVAAVVALHHPNVIKYFGGKKVVNGREELARGLASAFRNSRMTFVENTIESTFFSDSIAVETSIFGFRVTTKNGDSATLSRGRSMVVYVKDKDAPFGWLSIREMAQEAP